MRIIAVDPGEEHCGVVVFDTLLPAMRRGPSVMMATEMRPTQFFDWIYRSSECYSGGQECIVCEEFKLYPDKAISLSWSTLGTVEVIGVLREYCRVKEISFTLQPASIKKATRGIIRRRGITLTGKGPHAKDAELHGWYYLFNEKLI